MALLDLLVKDVADRFGIGDKARTLLSALLGLMNSDQTGGLLGFLDRFNRVGLNELVSSWVGAGPPKPLSTAQLESALGRETTQRVAANVGLAQPTVSSALASMVPRVVHQLTPDGYAPNGLPDTVRGYLPGAAGVATEETRRRAPAWLGILPLLALAGVTALGYRSCMQAPERGAESGPVTSAPRTAPTPPPVAPAVTPSPAPAATPPAPPVPAPAPVPTVNSRLSLSNIAGKIGFSGLAPDEATRASILDTLRTAFGMDNINGDISLNPAATPANWLAGLSAFLPDFKLPGAKVVFDGDSINVGGAIPEGDKTNLLDRLRSIFGPNFQLGDQVFTAEDASRAANEKAGRALQQLKPGFSGEDLISALNLIVINFATGSAQIPPDSRDLIGQAATALKAAPADVKVEIGGHTDSTGDADANLRLSQARADAVREALINLGVDPAMLEVKGYGDTRPVASNDTEEGRFHNRRIQYSLVR